MNSEQIIQIIDSKFSTYPFSIEVGKVWKTKEKKKVMYEGKRILMQVYVKEDHKYVEFHCLHEVLEKTKLYENNTVHYKPTYDNEYIIPVPFNYVEQFCDEVLKNSYSVKRIKSVDKEKFLSTIRNSNCNFIEHPSHERKVDFSLQGTFHI